MTRLSTHIGLDRLGWPVVVDIQNVAEYMVERERIDGEDKIWNPREDFPYWLSPWRVAAYEWREVRARGGIDSRRMVRSMTKRTADGRYNVLFEFFHLDPLGRLLCYGMEFTLPPNGGVPEELGEQVCVYSDDLGIETLRVNGLSAGDVLCATTPAVMAIAFLHCRNVTIRDETDHLTRQQRRRGEPAITYKVLDIGPMTRVLSDEGDVEHNGLKKALHICRGHFAHYDAEHPLFNKYVGTFWKPMHVRGKAKNGVVIKDYRVQVTES